MEPNPGFWAGKRVCVTGGTGFLGYHLVRQLLDLKARVTVLALAPRPDHPLISHGQVQNIFGDIRDLDLVQRAMSDCQVVFHTAGIVAVWGAARERMHSVHVTGTRNILTALPLKARLVHTSSVVTVGASLTSEPLTEDSTFKLHGLAVDYVHAKRASEILALEAARQKDVVVTNPGYLIGPQDYERSIMGRFCVRFWQGRVPLTPPGGFNLVDVRDVARGHLLAAEHGQSGRRYILGGENHDFRSFMAQLAEVMGLKPRALPSLPWWCLYTLARLSEARAWLTRREPYPSLQHVRLNRYCWFYRSDRARCELGFNARPLGVTLEDAYEWSADRGLVKLRGFNRWWMRPMRKAA